MSLFVNQNRDSLRAAWRLAWRRYCDGAPLEPLQAQIADVIAAHPEHHAFITSDAAVGCDFRPEAGRENPFLHMGLHLALQEQLGTNRPAGIRQLHRQLTRRAGSAHEAEHRMIEVLATILWDTQRSGRAPDEQQYLEALRRL